MNTKFSEVKDRCLVVPDDDALDAGTASHRLLSSHLRSRLQRVMTRVRPDDLSIAEIVALLDILTPADFRVVGGPASRP
jgi:hypothetical protein